jgi:hypothetical protein
MTHVMLDLAPWGSAPGSHLRSIGAIEFDPVAKSLGRDFYVNVAAQPTYGLTSDADTVHRWAEQSYEARIVFNDHPKILPVALARFTAWLRKLVADPNSIRIWAHGPVFDVILLTEAFAAASLPVPWHYRAPRDTRTIFDAAGMNPSTDLPVVGTYHNALDDARSQALGVIEAYRRLGI